MSGSPSPSGGTITFFADNSDIVPPTDIDAEESVIGSMLGSPKAAALAIEALRVDDFYRDIHRLIFSATQRLYDEGKHIDPVTVSSQLEREGKLDDAGGTAFLRTLQSAVPSPEHVALYIESVRDASTSRKVLRASYDVQERIRVGDAAPGDLIGMLEASLSRINEEAGRADFRVLRNIMFERYARLGEEVEDNSLSTGFASVDHLIGGFHPGQLYVLAARPGKGKTTLAINMAQKIALMQRGSVLIYSLEMSGEDLSDRIVSSMASVTTRSMRTGKMRAEDYIRVFDAIGVMEQADLHIEDDASLDLYELRAKSRRYAAENKISLIVVDYIQLMSLGGGRTESRQQEVAQMTRGLKKLAMELNVPILAVSQLNRELEDRKDKKPQLSDLRESGAIEQDADVVLFIYFDPEDESQTLAQIMVSKNRHGPTGLTRLVFSPEYTRFRDQGTL